MKHLPLGILITLFALLGHCTPLHAQNSDTTIIPDQTPLFSCDFEASDAMNIWEQRWVRSGGGTWSRVTDSKRPVGKRQTAQCKSGSLNPTNTWLITPNITLPADADGYYLRWMHRLVRGGSTSPTIEVRLAASADTIADGAPTSDYSTVLYTKTADVSNYESQQVSLAQYGGQTIRIAFVDIDNYGVCYVFIDDVEIVPTYKPEIALTVPDSVEVGDTLHLTATVIQGYTTGMTVEWHSTMEARGEATLTYDSLQATIVYNTDGIDTITVIANGRYGNDTSTATMWIPDPLRFFVPHTSIIADATRIDAPDTIGFKAVLTSGSSNGLGHTWSSTMASTGRATMDATLSADSITIVYLTAGHDTVTVATVNDYGIDYDTLIVAVCDSISLFPWRADFNEGIDCWYTTRSDNQSYYSWVATDGSALMGNIYGFDDPAGALITPPIVLPADSVLSLKWTARGYSLYSIKISPTGGTADSSFYLLRRDTIIRNTVHRHLDLDDYAGQTIRIGIFKEHTTAIFNSYLYIDSLAILPLYAPKVSISGPKHVLADSIGAHLSATLTQGLDSLLTYSWSSTMTNNGTATMYSLGSNVDILYSVGGTDTITCVVTNHFGSDTATFILGVGDCGTVAAEDYTNGFATKLDCWYQPADCRWRSNFSGSAISSVSNRHFRSYMVSQGVSIPADAGNDMVLEWEVNSSGAHLVHNYTIMVAVGDYTDTGNYTTLFVDTVDLTAAVQRRVNLGSYAGRVVHFVLVHDPINITNFAADVRTLAIMNLRVRDLRKPEVRIETPTTVFSNENNLVMARLDVGTSVGLSYTWSSTMAAAGWATMTVSADSLHINYSASGTDTLTCIATNAYGIDTATVVVTVIDCSPKSLPWTENFGTTPAVSYDAANGKLPNCWHSYWNGTNAVYAPHVIPTDGYQYIGTLPSPALLMLAGISSGFDTVGQVTLPRFIQPSQELAIAFDYCFENVSRGTLTVGYVDNSDTFVAIADMTPHSGSYRRDTVLLGAIPYSDASIALRWRYNGTFFYGVDIDDIEVFEVPFTHTVTVSSNVDGICQPYGSGRYLDSSTVEIGYNILDTIAEGGYWRFQGWSDGGTGNPRQILVVSDTTIVSLFEWVPTQGIEETGSSRWNVEVFPNPASTDVTVRVSRPSTLMLLDLQGRTVIPSTAVNTQFPIRKSQLAPGTYFLRVTTDNSTMTKKLVIL